jgi:thiol-disulfide isomerase/thioredoxin
MRFALGLALCITLAAGKAHAQEPVGMRIKPPEFADVTAWINTKPLKLADLEGKVVVLHFWTFGCINCIHNFPSYKAWQEKYAKKGLAIVGIHTPETRGEMNQDRLRQKLKEQKLDFPVAVDNTTKNWQAWNNRIWPCVYLIDKKGFVRYRWDGELNWKHVKGEEIMGKKIDELLAEKE